MNMAGDLPGALPDPGRGRCNWRAERGVLVHGESPGQRSRSRNTSAKPSLVSVRGNPCPTTRTPGARYAARTRAWSGESVAVECQEIRAASGGVYGNGSTIRVRNASFSP